MKLGVNIDHVATVREARYRGQQRGEPDPVAAAVICLENGAHGITAHLREDRRHMQDRDIFDLRQAISGRLNLEMGNSPEIVALALRVKPEIVCLVPERRQEITTEGGLDVAGQIEAIKATCTQMKQAGIDVSLFINPDPAQIEASVRTGANFVELHTGAFAEQDQDASAQQGELERLIKAAQHAHRVGLHVNAGHGLNYRNVTLMHQVPFLEELNIGHSIVSRAITTGISQAVRDMLRLLEPAAKPG